ncbi:hypothetical protein LTR66_006783 [Elasticomyces elasticus]|nr:hypothetical protein LTR66_006783 [Elasticomyces elasticus]
MESSPLHRDIPAYDEDIDFVVLASQDPDFAKVVDPASKTINFKDPKAVQQLTKSLLKRDFGVSIELPDDRLCPPVPVRYNYVHWIQSLLDTTSDRYDDRYDPDRKVLGLDIGTGASCIYPLLATSTRPQWRMFGTEVDSHSLDYAEHNVHLNDLEDRISLRRSTCDGPLIPLGALGLKQINFTICNPPFYSSKDDMESGHASKAVPPSAVCTGAEIEMICEGGDAGFVCRMIDESLVLRDRVQWYTSMLGKLSSLHTVVARLKEAGVKNWAITVLRAGSKTRRWAVGWSFVDRRPRNDIARDSDISHALLPLPAAQTIATFLKAQDASHSLNVILSGLNLRWDPATGIGFAKENVWSRAARRKLMRQRADQGTSGGAEASNTVMEDNSTTQTSNDNGQEDATLGFKTMVEDRAVTVRWLEGEDFVLFESFCSMLKRSLSTRTQS